jgi:hypothetical protein
MVKLCCAAITQDILGFIDLSLITASKRHLAQKYSRAASLEVAPPRPPHFWIQFYDRIRLFCSAYKLPF